MFFLCFIKGKCNNWIIKVNVKWRFFFFWNWLESLKKLEKASNSYSSEESHIDIDTLVWCSHLVAQLWNNVQTITLMQWVPWDNSVRDYQKCYRKLFIFTKHVQKVWFISCKYMFVHLSVLAMYNDRQNNWMH